VSAPQAGPVRGPLKFSGDLAVCPGGRRRTVPGPAVRLAWIGQHRGEGPVRLLALGEPGPSVHSRAHQRVAEFDAITSDVHKALRLSYRQRVQADSELGRRPRNSGALARLLTGDNQKHSSRLGR
jgi:hypothetical protein